MTLRNKKAVHQQSPSFLNYKATQKLLTLAEHPFDLTQLTPERITNYYAESCGFKLLYGTERINDKVLQALEELAQEAQALPKMQKMQAGEIVNYIQNHPSEHRSALHTATRDFFDHPQTAEKATEATHLARQEIDKLKAFLEKIDLDHHFQEMILIGIGGSDLGPRANYEALKFLQRPNRHVYFISNVDPDDATQVLRQIRPHHCLVVVVSKSGNTLETAVNEEFARQFFKAAGVNPKNHFISITTPNSPMDNPQNYLRSFYIWDWIGGRYSSTSMVGGLILSFACGFSVFWDFLKGAHAMDQAALQADLKKNIPLTAALLSIWNRNFLHYPTLALIPYSQALHRYPAHIQQLAMESNGKSIDQQGNFLNFETEPVIWGEPGTNAQHSFFQLIHQGTSIIPLSLIGFKQSQYLDDIEVGGTTSQEKLLANLFAQAIALATGQQSDNPNQVFAGNRPTNLLLCPRLTPFALGALLAYYEHLVAFQSFIWGINGFDQEGVQLGKVLASKMIERFAAHRGRVKERETLYPLGDAFLKHLDHL